MEHKITLDVLSQEDFADNLSATCSCGDFDWENPFPVDYDELGKATTEHLMPSMETAMRDMMRAIPKGDLIRSILKLRKS